MRQVLDGTKYSILTGLFSCSTFLLFSLGILVQTPRVVLPLLDTSQPSWLIQRATRLLVILSSRAYYLTFSSAALTSASQMAPSSVHYWAFQTKKEMSHPRITLEFCCWNSCALTYLHPAQICRNHRCVDTSSRAEKSGALT
jgi:hypothetical protein